MKHSTLIVIIIFFTQLVSCQQKKEMPINGAWIEKNDNPEQIIIISDTAKIDVVHGQICIDALLKYKEDSILVYLIKNSELGMGGARLSWTEFSREKKIASIMLTGDDSFKFTWFGFYNDNSQSYIFTECPFGRETIFLRRKE